MEARTIPIDDLDRTIALRTFRSMPPLYEGLIFLIV
jgi:hypothetical protein